MAEILPADRQKHRDGALLREAAEYGAVLALRREERGFRQITEPAVHAGPAVAVLARARHRGFPKRGGTQRGLSLRALQAEVVCHYYKQVQKRLSFSKYPNYW